MKKQTFNYYDMVIYAARGSNSARALATDLSCRRWREGVPNRYRGKRRPYFRGNKSPLIVNWGSTQRPDWLSDPRFSIVPRYLNDFTHVNAAIDKLKFFEAFGHDNPHVLEWTTSADEATDWLAVRPVFVRKHLRASSGEGIVVVPQGSDGVPKAPLYTRGFAKTHEFRVHVFRGKAIDFTEKKRTEEEQLRVRQDPDSDLSNSRRAVRSHDNGWVHAHENLALTSDARAEIESEAIKAVDLLRLDFGAVDVLAILKPGQGSRTLGRFKCGKAKFYICEVNTAPGLENTATIKAYSDAIRSYKESLR